jgi:uncharacterized membrane protein
MFKFYTHEAIPVSKLTIFAGAITSFLLNFGQLHPKRKAMSIDYNIPYLIVPLLLFGTMVGISLNKVMPPWIILIFLSILLFVNTYKTIKKGNSLRNIEIEEEKKYYELEAKNEKRKNSTISNISLTLAINNQTGYENYNNNLNSNITNKDIEFSK